jgi:hypothetical protein
MTGRTPPQRAGTLCVFTNGYLCSVLFTRSTLKTNIHIIHFLIRLCFRINSHKNVYLMLSKALLCPVPRGDVNLTPNLHSERGYLSRYSDWLRAGRSGVRIRWGQDFPHPSRPALGSTQFPVRLTPGVKRSGLGVDHPLSILLRG